MKRTSNRSEQRLFREEVLNSFRKNAGVFRWYLGNSRLYEGMKRTSNRSEQRLFCEEVLSFIQEKRRRFSLVSGKFKVV